MKQEFLLTREARSDIFEIWEYIALEANIEIADKVKTELYDACKALARFPEQGHTREDITDKPVKFWTVGAYAIIYNSKSDPLEIIRFLRWSRNISYLF